MIDLRGKKALVTGGAKRIGRAISLALGRAGAHVLVHYRNSKTEAESLVDELRKMGVQSWALQEDLSRANQAAELVPRAIKHADGLDFLINSASIFETSSLKDFSAEELQNNLQIHALSPLSMCRALAAQNKPTHVINLLDTHVHQYDSTHAAYHLSKRMLFDLTRMMALEFAPQMQVNAIAPGLVLPPPGKDRSYLEAQTDKAPLARVGNPQDLAEAVIFLLRNDFITGQVIHYDGGEHMKGRVYG
ncbi:MAG: SDR family oxidoreductase [Candidatus Sumerlaeia bacterium]